MRIEIKYNNNIDEFTCDLSLVMRLKRYIHDHFYLAYVISMLAPIYLVGGSIRDLIYAKKPKDMDFVVLGMEQLDWVLQIFEAYNIKYKMNKFGGYKFVYENTEIDLWLAEDLFSSMQYNVDGLYFNLNTNSLLSLTFNDFKRNGLRLINEENNIENDKEEKLFKFEKQYFDNENGKVKKYNLFE